MHFFTYNIVYSFLFIAPSILSQNVENGDVIMGFPEMPEDYEDLSEYKFQKFAATYFQVCVHRQRNHLRNINVN